MNQQQLEKMLEDGYMWFLENHYDNFKQNYNCSYPESLNQIVMWGEYIARCSEIELNDLAWEATGGEGLTQEEILLIREITAAKVDTMLHVYEPIIFPGLYAGRRKICQ